LDLVKELLVRASVAAETYGICAAQEWADGFVFSTDTRSRDATLFQLCSAKRALMASDRLSEERVRRLFELLAGCIMIPLRRKYKVEVSNAVNKLLNKQ
jgi:hypothetical protein